MPASPAGFRPLRLFSFSLMLLIGASGRAATPIDYAKEIRPLFQERCYSCHGALAQKAKLRVDSGAFLMKGGVLVPGKPDESEILARVSAEDEDTRMPPEGHPLKPEQIAKLKRWIEEGAKVPADDAPEPDPRDHWSFRPVQRPPVPTVANPAIAIRNPIDAFVAAKWQEKDLKPVGPAERRVLLRRVYLDLVGLPPTTAQMEAFLQDNRPDAYEQVVEQLLASPQYGERWGRHFLDIWRYSDWWGLGAELRNSQKHLWHWRDWAVESFNANLGYDEMMRQMIAADELYPTEPEKLRATGYLARPYFLFNRTTWLDEVVEHTTKGFLGMTFNCSKCHDHKYDPVSQVNYYQFRAIFEPYQVRTDLIPGEADIKKAGLPRAFDCNLDAKTPFHIRGDERNADTNRVITPGLPAFLAPRGLSIEPVKLPSAAFEPLRRPEIAATLLRQTELKWARALLEHASREERARGRSKIIEWALVGPSGNALAAARFELKQIEAAIADPGKAAVSLRGAIKSAESNVETAESRSRQFPATSTGRRTALARWLSDRENPLTARVAVNHLWLRHFGNPLVSTVFEFGRKGTLPTHPELLNWLAAEFMDHQWSFKHLHRLMVTSSVYRLSSSNLNAVESTQRDPENRYLWRMNPQRLQAQAIRDSLLHLAGELDLTRGGPPIAMAQQENSRRRAMYFFHSHNEHNKLLDVFDNANVLDCYRRTESIVPQQALALWNSKLALEMAGKINDQLHTRHKDADDARFVTAAFELVLGTPPTSNELATCEEALIDLRAALPKLNEPQKTQRARLQVILALINHNDFITVR